ncbi:MAG: hypothetical protein GY832_04380 [Chloroflexi bacterium]|nr:hypothetical protein [Chloroflexota bacterium]
MSTEETLGGGTTGSGGGFTWGNKPNAIFASSGGGSSDLSHLERKG